MYIPEIENYINLIKNNNLNDNKKKLFNDDYDDIHNALIDKAFNILLSLSENILELKNNELKLFLNNLKNSINGLIDIYKNNNKVNILMSQINKIKIIAEFAIIKIIIDKIIIFIRCNKNKKLKECINIVKNNKELQNNIQNKKLKTNNQEYESISSSSSSSSSSNSSSSSSSSSDSENDDENNYKTDDKNENDNEINYKVDNNENNDDDNEDNEDDTDNKDNEDSKDDIENKKLTSDIFINTMFTNNYNNPYEDIINYFNNLSKKEKNVKFNKLLKINNYQSDLKPVPFKIMDLPLDISQKNHILKSYVSILSSDHSEQKLKTWFDSLMRIPFGIYKGINLNKFNLNDDNTINDITTFLDNLKITMDNAVYGHEEAKRQIIQIMGQQIKNPKSQGNIIGLWGVPGNGKTSLIKEGISKAMDKPFIFISLGGATDASFLEGHSYTYEGSLYGRIVNGLITSKCMNPIIYFDELDKISKTYKGEEIENILIHLTDPVQNTNFRDKYFHGIDIDLSQVTFIFSYNNPSNINPILLDRITGIETKYLLTSQKIHIAQNYLLPNILKDMIYDKDDIKISDQLINEIIVKYTHEGGVRKLKSLLYNIIKEINLLYLTKSLNDDNSIVFPFTILSKHLKTFLKNKIEIDIEKINLIDKSGRVNGLYANSLGMGGILPIQILWIPSDKPLALKATGSLEKVIKESTEVACSLAWNYLSTDLKDKYLSDWKDKPMGFHIHCPDGSVSKDGPSAGAAITLALFSLLTNKKIKNDIAMTGEINLEGNITAIGGLEEKLEGAKRAGVTLVLFPKENLQHLEKIKERNKTLLDNNFKVQYIETFEDVIKYALI